MKEKTAARVWRSPETFCQAHTCGLISASLPHPGYFNSSRNNNAFKYRDLNSEALAFVSTSSL